MLKSPETKKKSREWGFSMLPWNRPSTSGSVNGKMISSMASLSSDEEDAARRCFRSTNHEQINGYAPRGASHNSSSVRIKKMNVTPKPIKVNVYSKPSQQSNKHFTAFGMNKNIGPTMSLLEDDSSSDGDSENFNMNNTHLGDGTGAFRSYKLHDIQNLNGACNIPKSTIQGFKNSDYIYDPYLSAEQFRLKWGHRGEFDDYIDNVQDTNNSNYGNRFGQKKKRTSRFRFSGSIIIFLLVSILLLSVLFVAYDQSGEDGLFSGTPGKLSNCDGKDITVTGKAKCESRNDFVLKEMYARSTLKALQEATSSAYCQEGIKNKPISQEEIAQYLAKEHNISEQEALWQLRSVLQILEDVLTKSNDGYLTLKKFRIPWMCSLYNWFTSAAGYLIRFITGCAVIIAFYIISRWRVIRKQVIEKEISDLTDNVVTLLQKNIIRDDYIVISSVRDQLIPPQYREKKKDIWNEVRKQVAESVPHVKEETKLIDEEVVEVWSFLQDDKPATRKLRKVWQGEAFGTSEGSINCPVMSPTECLKVRHMFDPISELNNEEDWVGRIKDAILERCDGMKILHMSVDEDSREGCVYLKCATHIDAGEVYKKIHGVWFDGRIISAKYLRLKRYIERFPEAVSATEQLTPSNNLRLSMRNC